MTGLCVSGRLLSAGDVSIRVTEHHPHLLWEETRNRKPPQTLAGRIYAAFPETDFKSRLLIWRRSGTPPPSPLPRPFSNEQKGPDGPRGPPLTAARLASAGSGPTFPFFLC